MYAMLTFVEPHMQRLGLTILAILYALTGHAQDSGMRCQDPNSNLPECFSISNDLPMNVFDAKVKPGPHYGLSEREARDNLFNTITTQAVTTRNAALLDIIPLNSITTDQQSKLFALRIQIGQLVRTDQAQNLDDANLREARALEHAMSEIVKAHLEGKPIDVEAMSKITFSDENGQEKTVIKRELLDYARQMKLHPVAPAESLAFAMGLSEKIARAKITGHFGDVFEGDMVYGPLAAKNPRLSDAELASAIAADRRMNETERTQLIRALPEMKTSNR